MTRKRAGQHRFLRVLSGRGIARFFGPNEGATGSARQTPLAKIASALASGGENGVGVVEGRGVWCGALDAEPKEFAEVGGGVVVAEVVGPAPWGGVDVGVDEVGVGAVVKEQPGLIDIACFGERPVEDWARVQSTAYQTMAPHRSLTRERVMRRFPGQTDRGWLRRQAPGV